MMKHIAMMAMMVMLLLAGSAVAQSPYQKGSQGQPVLTIRNPGTEVGLRQPVWGEELVQVVLIGQSVRTGAADLCALSLAAVWCRKRRCMTAR